MKLVERRLIFAWLSFSLKSKGGSIKLLAFALTPDLSPRLLLHHFHYIFSLNQLGDMRQRAAVRN